MARKQLKPLSRFWRSLERLPGQATTETHWRHLLGPDHERVASMLVPENRLAQSVPRCDGSGRHYTVVEHGYDDFVGVCESDGDCIRLSRRELVLRRLDIKKLLNAVAQAIDIQLELTATSDHPNSSVIGSVRPAAGFVFPILFTTIGEKAFQPLLDSLLWSMQHPFLLLTPTARPIRPACSRRYLPLVLEDILVGETLPWRLAPEARGVIDAFLQQFLPSREESSAFFAVPARTTWSMLRIRFLDGHRVSVSVGETTQTFNYTQMGMADRRNGNPTKQWELLRGFAKERGVITWESKFAARENQKRKDTLSENLKVFFRIDGEPFSLLENGQGWETAFALEPE